MNLAACRRLSLRPINAIWYRAISAEHWEIWPLRTEQTMRSPNRYNPGQAIKSPFEILYLAENQLVTYLRGRGLVRAARPAYRPSEPRGKNDTDRCERAAYGRSPISPTPSNWRLLETSAQELTGILEQLSAG